MSTKKKLDNKMNWSDNWFFFCKEIVKYSSFCVSYFKWNNVRLSRIICIIRSELKHTKSIETQNEAFAHRTIEPSSDWNHLLFISIFSFYKNINMTSCRWKTTKAGSSVKCYCFISMFLFYFLIHILLLIIYHNE